MRFTPLEVKDGLAYEDFVRDHLRPHRPVHIKNAFPQWRALGKWTPAYFRTRYGDRSVTVAGEELRLGAYLDRVEAADPAHPVPYLRELSVRSFAPELGEDLTPFVAYALPNWLRGIYPDREIDVHLNRASEVELFIGGAGTKLERRRGETEDVPGGLHGSLIQGYSDLHYDPTACPVLLCQVFGAKEWWVFSPEQTPYLYAEGRLAGLPDLEAVDYQRFPLAEQAVGYRFLQEPGDAVYVPPFWWHATKMRSVSIAVGTTFANGAHWDGVIEDITRGRPALQARALGAALRLDGAVKARLGARLGEASHFVDPPLRSALRKVKGALKSALRSGG